MAGSSVKVYSQGLNSFEQFRKDQGFLETWPVPLNELVSYIAFMFRAGFAHSTVSCYMSGISFYNKLNELEDNTQRFIVRKLLDGYKRLSSNKDSRLPISRSLLRDIISVLPNICKSGYESKLFKSAFSLCFHGMFRVSELTFKGPNFSDHAITSQNVAFVNGGVEVFLQTSKTDQHGAGVTIFIPSQDDISVCPVNSLLAFKAVRGNQYGPLFRHFDKSPLTSYQFSAMLKNALKTLGIIDSKITSHSFRIGMATALAMESVGDEQIKKLGRWKSSVYLRYIRIPS